MSDDRHVGFLSSSFQRISGDKILGEILQIIEKFSGGKCYQTERFNLDHFVPPEYQDEKEVFNNDRIFETDNKARKNIQIDIEDSVDSLLKYFLDGSRRTYKIADFGSTDGKFLPLVAGQIGTAVCFRQDKKLKQYRLKRKNVIAVPDRMGDEFEKITQEIPKIRIPKDKKNGLSISQVLKYTVKSNIDSPIENFAIAAIQYEMMKMEIELIREMVRSNKLKTNEMLIVDGSLQFSGVEDEDTIFQNVIGISKSFNPNLQGILQSKNKQIGTHLTNLEFGERTPVFVYKAEGKKKTKTTIGAWYLRIHHKENLKKPSIRRLIHSIVSAVSPSDESFFPGQDLLYKHFLPDV